MLHDMNTHSNKASVRRRAQPLANHRTKSETKITRTTIITIIAIPVEVVIEREK